MNTDKWHGGVPTDHLPRARSRLTAIFHDPTIAKMAHAAMVTGAKMTMGTVPASTGIGAPGTQPAPADLSRSPMAAQPGAAAPSAIPFTRGSTIGTMQDATRAYAAGASDQIQLQTNAFLEAVLLDFTLTTAGNAAAVAFALDGPFNAIANIKWDDPAGQNIGGPITGFQLFVLNKYLPDTACAFDPQLDPNYSAVTGSGATGGSFSFRLVIPIEHRRRDAFGATNNSAANQRYLITINIISTFGGTTGIYTVAPTTPATTLNLQVSQYYWTSPPGSITTPNGQVQVMQKPSGLGSVGFVRFEQHSEATGGGAPQIQMNNVGDYISDIIFVNRTNAAGTARDTADWPSPFQWWVNDFQTQNLYLRVWQRWMARAYRYTGALGAVGGVDTGVFVLPFLSDIFDRAENFAPAPQYIATDATTKLQIRGSTFGAAQGNIEVLTRLIRPVSGSALFS